MKIVSKLFAATVLSLAIHHAQAVTISFDEFSASNNNVAIEGIYAASGVTFSNENSGIWGGNSQGDPGNWGIEGTNGGGFLGNNGFNNSGTYTTRINFANLASNISFDASRSNGSGAGQQLTASAYNGSTLLSAQSMLLGAVNSWSSLVFGIGGITSLIITGTTTGFSPFGIDNLQFSEGTLLSGIDQEVTAIPEPETYALMLAGLGLIGGFTRQRKTGISTEQ